MFSQDEFKKYATKHKGISSLNLHRFESAISSYINPTIIEERQLNVASMDVFSRLMMDRIIFLGVPIDDDVANIIMAQLLFLESADPSKDIQIYFNHSGRFRLCRIRYLRHDAIHSMRRGNHLYRDGRIHGCRADDCRNQRKTFRITALTHHDPSTDGWSPRPSLRY